MNRAEADAITMLKNLKNSNGMSTGYTSGFNECMDRAIQALESLDKIRAEILSYKDDKVIHAERNEMIDIVLEIINKHIERSEEE